MRFLERWLQWLCMGSLCVACAQAVATTPSRHYEYLFYLSATPARDLVAEARAQVPTALAHHQLLDPAALRLWDGRGRPPIAFERRVADKALLQDGEIFDTAEPLTEVLGATPARPVAVLAVMVGVPQRPDVPAYVEALELSIAIARALRAPAFVDKETSELRRIGNLAERRTNGLAGAQTPVSATNLPRVTMMGGATVQEPLLGGGVRTFGLRKFGVPDLVVEDWVPGLPANWVLEVMGALLVSGKVPPVAGALVSVRVDDADVRSALFGGGRSGAAASVRLSLAPGAAPSTLPQALAVEVEGPAGLHRYERQMLFVDTMLGPLYPALTLTQSQELLRAIARSKLKASELRRRFNALHQGGTQVFVAFLGQAAMKEISPRQLWWAEVVAWADDGTMQVRRWTGDPRTGGTAVRLMPPVVVEGQTFHFVDSNASDDQVEDWLLLRRAARPEGGEVAALLHRFAAEKQAGQRAR